MDVMREIVGKRMMPPGLILIDPEVIGSRRFSAL